MTSAEETHDAEALDWVRRIHDPSFADWDGHIAWLEADPDHVRRFDEALLLIEQGTAHLTPLPMVAPAPPVAVAVNDNGDAVRTDRPQRPWRRSRWGAGLGGALAAGIAAAVALPSLIGGGAQPYRIETAPGTTRAVSLADGTRVMLNGGSAVRLDRADARIATLERGEAFFSVVHDSAHPFTVEAGGARFQDIGTAFDVISSGGDTRVAVQEGAVMYDPAGAAVRLERGQAIALNGSGAMVRAIDPGSVGQWRHGRLSYRDSPLPDVAADLSRTIGRSVAVDPRLTGRRFTGVIVLDRDRDRMIRRAAAVMDVSIRDDGAGLRILPPAR